MYCLPIIALFITGIHGAAKSTPNDQGMKDCKSPNPRIARNSHRHVHLDELELAQIRRDYKGALKAIHPINIQRSFKEIVGAPQKGMLGYIHDHSLALGRGSVQKEKGTYHYLTFKVHQTFGRQGFSKKINKEGIIVIYWFNGGQLMKTEMFDLYPSGNVCHRFTVVPTTEMLPSVVKSIQELYNPQGFRWRGVELKHFNSGTHIAGTEGNPVWVMREELPEEGACAELGRTTSTLVNTFLKILEAVPEFADEVY